MKTERGQERGEITGPNQTGDFLFCVIEWVETGEQVPAIRVISVRLAKPKERLRFMKIKGLTGNQQASLDEDAVSKKERQVRDDVKSDSAIASGAPVQSFKDWFLRRVELQKATKDK